MADLNLDFCPDCGRVGDERETCGRIGGMPCPEPQPVDFTTVAVLRCGPCNRTRAFTVQDMMHPERMPQRHSGICQSMQCQGKLLVPAAETGAKVAPKTPKA